MSSWGTVVPQHPQKKNSELPVIWPMNAQGVKDAAHLEQLFNDPNYVAQEKLDGMRVVVHVTRDGLRIFSRSAGVNDPTRPLEKTSALPHLANLQYPQLAGTVLDCEILAPGQDSASIAGTVHRKNGNGATQAVKLYVFDCLHFNGKDITHQTLSFRLSMLTVIAPKIDSPYISFLQYAFSPTLKRALYKSVLARGGEGIILKNLRADYIQGGRPAENWYKQKKAATFDCVVMGFTRGAGKYNDRIGAIKFGQFVNGKLTELGQASGMSDQERKQMSEFPRSYIGKVVTIKGMERLRSGAIRHPQFAGIRLDKRSADCVWYNSEQ